MNYDHKYFKIILNVITDLYDRFHFQKKQALAVFIPISCV